MKKVITLTAAAALSLGVATADSVDDRISKLENEIASLKGSQGAKGSVLGAVGNAGWAERSSFGGYGEVHYNNFEGKDDEIDFHRFVLFFNHEFNDKWRFISELEVEHALAGDGKPGEVEIEQAFIEMDLTNDSQFRAGLFLIPVGIMNETHEPPTFFGVERNSVEKNIIPTTWWEAGLGYTKKFDNGFAWDFALSSGLNIQATGANAGVIRKGRGKVAEAIADSLAITNRVAYTGIAGVKATAFFQYNTDPVQDDLGSDSGLLYGATFEYDNGGFGFRALYAKWDLSGSIPDEAKDQSGFYLEPSYTFTLQNDTQLGFFARYEDMEYFKGGSLKEDDVVTVGVNFWPYENIVFKGDYQKIDSNGSDSDQWNLGVGYQF